MPQRDLSADGLMRAIDAKRRKRWEEAGNNRFYVRLSIERWRPLRRAMAKWLRIPPDEARAAELDDKMPDEYGGGGVQVYGMPVAIQKSKLSKRLFAQGLKPLTFL